MLFASLIGCSKKGSPSPPASVSYSLNSSVSASAPNAIITFENPGAVLECNLYPPGENSGDPAGTYSGSTYLFSFEQSSGPVAYGLQFEIPVDSLPSGKLAAGISETFKLTASVFSPCLGQCISMSSPSELVTASDSANISISISRYSSGSIDGTFEAQFYGINYAYAYISSGTFMNLPVKSN